MQNITNYASINPVNNKLIKVYDFLSDAVLEAKLAEAEKGYNLNKARTFAERAAILIKMGHILESRAEDLAEVISMEMGKPLAAAKLEVLKTANHCKYYAENAEKMLVPKPVPCAAKEAYVAYQPIGPLICRLLIKPRHSALKLPSLATVQMWSSQFNVRKHFATETVTDYTSMRNTAGRDDA